MKNLILILLFVCLGSQAQPDWGCADDVSSNPSSHLIFIPDTVKFSTGCLNVGDYVGLFYLDNGVEKCIGFDIWQGTDMGITVFGDDPLTDEKEGFDSGELINIRVWNHLVAESYQASSIYTDPANYFAVDAVGFFSDGSISLIDEIAIQLGNKKNAFFNILLEGPYLSNGLMEENSLNHPNTHPYGSFPYDHNGNEMVQNFPNNVIDWIMVEARSGEAQATGSQKSTTVEETKVGLLLSDGRIVSPTLGSSLVFNNLSIGTDYHFCIRHRNHLDVISSKKFVMGYPFLIDFTRNANTALGNAQLIQTDDGYFTMYTGDFSHDGIIQSTDFDLWKLNPAANNVYQPEDANLDGVIQISDYDSWFRNKAKLGIIEVRY